MKRLMIVGASVLQLPAIRKAKEMGLYVGVADYNPQAVGVPEADEFFCVSTIDEQGVCEASRQFHADGIMTLATDMPMRSVAFTCEKLGLTGISYETAVKATDKGEMIKAFEQAGVAHPWYWLHTPGAPLPETVSFPCITKPTDNSGSRGVMLVKNAEQLQTALTYSAENGRCGATLIEEYMQGPEVSVEVMVIDGVPHVLQITDKLTTGAPHFVEMGHSQPSRLPEATCAQIRDLAGRAALSVGIGNGPAHVEIIVTEDGPKLVELGARMGGDCITTHLVPLSTGVDMVRATIELALGHQPDVMPTAKMGAAIRYFNAPCGQIRSVHGVEQAEALDGIREITFTKHPGEQNGEIGNSADRIGFVVAQSNTSQEAVRQCEQAIHSIKIEVD